MSAKCKRCGRPLTSPESIKAGYGRECARGARGREGKSYKVCSTCSLRHDKEECPKCQPDLDPFSMLDEKAHTGTDSQGRKDG